MAGGVAMVVSEDAATEELPSPSQKPSSLLSSVEPSQTLPEDDVEATNTGSEDSSLTLLTEPPLGEGTEALAAGNDKDNTEPTTIGAERAQDVSRVGTSSVAAVPALSETNSAALPPPKETPVLLEVDIHNDREQSLRSILPPPPSSAARRSSTYSSSSEVHSSISVSSSFASSVFLEKPSPSERRSSEKSECQPPSCQESISLSLLAPFEPNKFVAYCEDEEEEGQLGVEVLSRTGSHVDTDKGKDKDNDKETVEEPLGPEPIEPAFAGSLPPQLSPSRIRAHRQFVSSSVSESSKVPMVNNNSQTRSLSLIPHLDASSRHRSDDSKSSNMASSSRFRSRNIEQSASADEKHHHVSPNHKEMMLRGMTASPSSQQQASPPLSPQSSYSRFSEKDSRKQRNRRHHLHQNAQSASTNSLSSQDSTSTTSSFRGSGRGRLRASTAAAIHARRLKSSSGFKSSITGGSGRLQSPQKPSSSRSLSSMSTASSSNRRPDGSSILDSKDRLKARATPVTRSHTTSRASDHEHPHNEDGSEEESAPRPGAFAVPPEDNESDDVDVDRGLRYPVRQQHRQADNFENPNVRQENDNYDDEEQEPNGTHHCHGHSLEGEVELGTPFFRSSGLASTHENDRHDDYDDDGADQSQSRDSVSTVFPADSCWGGDRAGHSLLASSDPDGGDDGARSPSHRFAHSERQFSFQASPHSSPSERQGSRRTSASSMNNPLNGHGYPSHVNYGMALADDQGDGSSDDGRDDGVDAYVAPEVVDAREVDVLNDEEETTQKTFRQAKHVWMLCCLFTLVAAIVTPTAIILSWEDDASIGVTLDPTPDPSVTPSAFPSAAPSSVRFVDVVNSLVDQAVLDRSSMELVNDTLSSPAYHAVVWLANIDRMQRAHTDERLLQRYVLAVFYFSTIRSGHWERCGFRRACARGNSFLSDTDECTWVGVKCIDGLIDSFNADFVSGLDGPLVTEIAKLPRLTLLHLKRKSLTGSIPSEYGTMPRVHTLILSANFLTGTIPAAFANNTVLSTLTLGENRLTGTFPSSLTQIPNLETLYMAFNKFWGILPTELGRLTKLKALDLGRNQFTGPIPSTLGQLKELHMLRLTNNRFNSSVPDSMWQLPKMATWELSVNNLTGSIPSSLVASLGSANRVRQFNVSFNRMTGTIPSELAQLTNLAKASFDANVFTGRMPSEICDLTESALQELEADCEEVECRCCTNC